MELSFVIDGVEKSVSVEKKGDHYLFTIEGREYLVSASPLADGSLSFFIDNRSYVALISKVEGQEEIALCGRAFLLSRSGDRETSDEAPTSLHGDGRVESPMPGNIVAVVASEGDVVKAGDAVVVIESMKMQNEIAAPVAGKITRVACRVGDQVNFGDVLLEISPDR